MKFLSYVLFWFLVFFAFIFLGTGDGDQNINQEGYFKQNQNRIFSFSFDENVPKKAIKDHAQKQMNTSGKMTAAYYFTVGSDIPRDGITRASSMAEANYVLYELDGISRWKYAYMKGFSGESIFVDCSEDKNNDLCRNK